VPSPTLTRVPALIVAYIDGGARGNPGPAGFGVRIEEPDGTAIAEFCESIGIATNNVAEYRGLIAALEWAKRHGDREVQIRSDSQLLVRQMLGTYKVRHPGLQPLHEKARQLAHGIGRVRFEYVPREQNAHADRLANLAMDGKVVGGPRSPDEGGQSSEIARELSVVTPAPKAPGAESVTPSARAASAADPLTPAERAVRLFVYRHFVETTRAPDIGTIAAAVQADQRAVLAALRKLVAAHALVMAPASTKIWMAHPFSAVPTAYPVHTRGRTYWANCAWDAAGVMALLGGGETRTRCADCGAMLTIAVRDGRMTGDGVVHYAVPPREFWDNVAYT
jgi:ribonuclease HI